MKGWHKTFELDEYDVLVQRLSNDDEQEHVVISLRFDGGMFSQIVLFDDVEADADLFYSKYSKKQAEVFVKTFSKEFALENDNKEQSNKEED